MGDQLSTAERSSSRNPTALRTSPVLTVRQLSKRYPGKTLLDHVSFELDRQKIYALMGANGAGKTTLLNILTGFVRPDAGVVLLHGQPIGHLQPHERTRTGMSRSFQDLRLITTMTVRDNLLLATGRDPTDAWAKALVAPFFKSGAHLLLSVIEGLLKEFSLSADTVAGNLSYGQQKLLTVACAAANGGDLLLLDEPVASVSAEHVHRITMSLRRLRSQGATIVLIEHNSDFVRSIADQILFLSDGHLQHYTTLDALRADPFARGSYR